MAAHWLRTRRLIERMSLLFQGFTISLLIACCGCAGIRGNSQPFINETSMNDSAFDTTASTDWAQAQHTLATQTINLTAGVFGVNEVPSDPRALTVQAQGITVRSVPDAPGHPGIIPCGSVTGYCYAYLDNEHTIIVPDSRPQNMGPYEMETIILWQLGYDVSRR